MRAAKVILVFPGAEVLGELLGSPDGPVEFILVGPKAPLHAELGATIGLDALDGHREPPPDLLEERDGGLDGVVLVDLQDPAPRGFVNGGKLIQAPRAQLEVLASFGSFS
jgi:hypothetical protein